MGCIIGTKLLFGFDPSLIVKDTVWAEVESAGYDKRIYKQSKSFKPYIDDYVYKFVAFCIR